MTKTRETKSGRRCGLRRARPVDASASHRDHTSDCRTQPTAHAHARSCRNAASRAHGSYDHGLPQKRKPADKFELAILKSAFFNHRLQFRLRKEFNVPAIPVDSEVFVH